jgi:flagellar biosynthesis protein FlhB
MANPGQDEDRSEKATPFKLEEARRQGQVARSPDIVSLVVLSAVMVSAFAMTEWSTRQTLDLAARLLSSSGQVVLSPGFVLDLGPWVASALLGIIAPLLVIVITASIVANLLISGPVFSFKPLAPQFNRMNPVQGLKRIFSLRTLFETGKTLVKILLIIVATYLAIGSLMSDLFELPGAEPGEIPAILTHLGGITLFAILAALLLVALIDVAFTKWEFQRQMRMSRRELRDEMRRREGDPQIKAKRRQLLASLQSKSRSIGKVKDASLIVVNPTHIAVALQYRRREMPAPKIVAKGEGEMARQIRAIGFRHRIPVIEDPALARQLYEVDVDGYIPEASFEPVAAALRAAWRLE